MIKKRQILFFRHFFLFSAFLAINNTMFSMEKLNLDKNAMIKQVKELGLGGAGVHDLSNLTYYNNPQRGLRIAVLHNTIGKVKDYFDLGAQVNPSGSNENENENTNDNQGDNCSSPLFIALSSITLPPNPDMIELLCQHGANTNERYGKSKNKEGEGQTPLHYVITSNLPFFYKKNKDAIISIENCIDILISHGAQLGALVNLSGIDLRLKYERIESERALKLINGTPLDTAVVYGVLPAIKKLLIPTTLTCCDAIYENPEDSKKLVTTWLLIDKEKEISIPFDILQNIFQHLPGYNATMLSASVKQNPTESHIDHCLNNVSRPWIVQLLKDETISQETKEKIFTQLKELLATKISQLIQDREYNKLIEEQTTINSSDKHYSYKFPTMASEIQTFFDMEDADETRRKLIEEYVDSIKEKPELLLVPKG